LQLLLPVSIQSSQTFSSFVEAKASNGLINSSLKACFDSPEFSCAVIVGAESSGKSHLLSACCNLANELSKTSMLLPLEQVSELSPEVIDGLGDVEVICVDNLQYIAGNAGWETAIFNLFNVLQQNKAKLFISATGLPNDLSIELPDLVSRLQWGTLFQLISLDNEEKISALIQHAHQMGFELSEEVASFMLNRLPRKMVFLMQALNTLAKQSIEQQRMVTVPFVKQVLEI